MNSQISIDDPTAANLIETAKAFQNAYITNDYSTSSTYLSNNFDTSIYNSSGQPLVLQNKDEIGFWSRIENFGRFEMSNFKVSFSKDKN